jgi:ABC-2 type transport system ATP-binding protein
MIVVDNVSKYYGEHRAVADLSFEIREGECVGFLGLNGAGKSTTLRLLACLLLPTAGRITVRGFDVVTHPHEIRKLIGYLPDTPPLYLEMTVREYLDFAARLRGLSGGEIDRSRERAYELCSLKDVGNAPIAELSHGYRQRVGIAQAIIHGPSLLILDEPIQGLDPVQIVEMRKMIATLRGEHTILLSTHILTEIEATCDRILVMNRGRVAAQGTEAELSQRLAAGHTLTLDVHGQLDALQRALATIPDLTGLRIERQSDGSLRAQVEIDQAQRPKVSRAVVEAGLDLVGMRLESSGLEALFLKLSQGSSSEGSSNAPASATSSERSEAAAT